MKNLANCKPSEFLRQTNRIRKSVEKWLDVTDIMNIRKRMPKYKEVPAKADAAKRKLIAEENFKRKAEQAKANLSDMLDEALEKHPDETLEILALCCFVEPEDVDNHSMADYISSFNELVSNEAVISFFSLLMQVGQRSTSLASQA